MAFCMVLWLNFAVDFSGMAYIFLAINLLFCVFEVLIFTVQTIIYNFCSIIYKCTIVNRAEKAIRSLMGDRKNPKEYFPCSLIRKVAMIKQVQLVA